MHLAGFHWGYKKNGNNFISSQKSHDPISIGRSLSDNKLEKGKRETDVIQTHTSPHQHLSQPHTHTRQGRAATNAFTRWSIFAFRWSTDETVTGVSGGTFVCQCKWVSVCLCVLFVWLNRFFAKHTHTHPLAACWLYSSWHAISHMLAPNTCLLTRPLHQFLRTFLSSHRLSLLFLLPSNHIQPSPLPPLPPRSYLLPSTPPPDTGYLLVWSLTAQRETWS